MAKLYIIFIWLLVILSGGCAITEVLTGAGTVAGLILVLAGLSIIVYITRLPDNVKGN